MAASAYYPSAPFKDAAIFPFYLKPFTVFLILIRENVGFEEFPRTHGFIAAAVWMLVFHLFPWSTVTFSPSHDQKH